MNRKQIFIIAIVIILAVDAIAWYATYRVATEPSPEQVRMTATAVE